MSAEQEPGAPLKRPRGVDGGLEGLAGAGLQLGSPEKKHKGGAQGAPFPAPPSEYAPPANPSAEYLIAVNPFDDRYAAAAYKPVRGPYFAGPVYPAFGGYNAFRMPPHLLPRVASPCGAPAFPLRHQPPPFGQSPAGAAFSRAPAVTFGPPENAAAFGHQLYSASQALPGPGQPFRPNQGENFGHMPSQNAGPTPPSTGHLGAGPNPAFGSSLTEPNHSYTPGPPTYYKQVKAFTKLEVNKHQPPSQQHHHTLLRSEDPLSSGSRDVKASGHRHAPAGTPEGVLPKRMENLKSAHANGTPVKPCLPCGRPEGSSSEKAGWGGSGSKTPLHPPQHGHLPSEPLYPCGICTHEVNDDQDAILCEASCQKWFHRICTGMTESAYGLLTAEASAVWGCDICMADKDVQLMRTREMAGLPALNTDA
ncbi:pygopus homolog 1 [Notechis scutatus]|uniref:Pygopus homolog 1 n=1 Tax=Notechis scutatus TaxID=8663 RepID=A0A6J1VDE7_9SAUR|nr:pygopus homolog 1 [Notechis scutatus]